MSSFFPQLRAAFAHQRAVFAHLHAATTPRERWLAVSLLTLVAAGGALLGRSKLAVADGVPAAPLVYAGFLEDASGNPANGTFPVTALIYDAETAGVVLCNTNGQLVVTRGFFSLPLDPACTVSVRSGPDRFLQLTVMGSTLPRQRIGAVPYALEATRAMEAGGQLEAALNEGAKKTEAASKVAADAQKAATDTQKTATDAKTKADAVDGRLGSAKTFVKGGNNGTVSCDEYCNGTQWGTSGTCVAARAHNTASYIPCSVALKGYGPADCLCMTW